MFTRSRRPQGYQVRKSRVQLPLDYFAQNGIQVPVTQDDPPEREKGYLERLYDYFFEEEPQGYQGLSHPKRPESKGPAFTPIKGEFAYDDDAVVTEEMLRRAEGSSGPLPIKEPITQPQVQQPQGGSAMPTSAERKVIQRWYESSNNPSADSGYAGGLYGIAEGALTDAINDGIVPAGSDVYDPVVNEKVRDYYIDKMYNSGWVKNAETNISRLARAYSAYNQGGGRAVEGWNAAKAAGYNINPNTPEELVSLMDAKGGGEYDGYFWPQETRDYVKGIVAGQFDPKRLPEGFQLGQQMDEGGMLDDGEPIDPKKMAMYNQAFKKTMGDDYENVPPELIAKITNLVAGGDLLSKTDEINANLVALRKMGLDTDLLFENLTEAEGGGFGAKMKYGAAARMFSPE